MAVGKPDFWSSTGTSAIEQISGQARWMKYHYKSLNDGTNETVELYTVPSGKQVLVMGIVMCGIDPFADQVLSNIQHYLELKDNGTTVFGVSFIGQLVVSLPPECAIIFDAGAVINSKITCRGSKDNVLFWVHYYGVEVDV